MTTIAQTKVRTASKIAIARENPITWRDSKRSLYEWLRKECKEQKISIQVQRIVEEIISCANYKGVTNMTNETLLNRYNARYPADPISMRTLYRRLSTAQEKKLIKKPPQQGYKKSCCTKLLAPKLVIRSLPSWHTYLCSKATENIRAAFVAATPPLPPQQNEQNEQKTNRRRLLEMIQG